MKYSASHEWITVSDGIGTVGISDFAQNELGDIVYIDLPKIGATVRSGEEVVVLESTKAAADIYSPVSGEIISVNEQLKADPQSVNRSPQDKGWLYTIRITQSD